MNREGSGSSHPALSTFPLELGALGNEMFISKRLEARGREDAHPSPRKLLEEPRAVCRLGNYRRAAPASCPAHLPLKCMVRHDGEMCLLISLI